MKIEIVTIHRLNNFGSAFQAMALYEYIDKLGYDVELLDYDPPYYKGRELKNYISRIVFFSTIKRRTQKFDRFIEEHTKLSIKRYHSYKEINEAYPEADLYIAGGDQLWNYHHICGNDDVYKLWFYKGKKISYGTSMGGDRFSKEQLCDLKEKVAGFESIALREKQSLDIFKDLGLKATWVVDPVMLLPVKRYEELMKDPNEKSPYVFVYLVAHSEFLEKAVEYLSKICGLKVIVYSGLGHKCKCDEQKRELGPEEVIGYIKNAEFVLSSSFHATVFSILFKKKFSVILPGETTNQRLYDLLSWTGLEDTMIQNMEQLEELYKRENWYTEELSKTIKGRIQSSEDYLKTAIESALRNES